MSNLRGVEVKRACDFFQRFVFAFPSSCISSPATKSSSCLPRRAVGEPVTFSRHKDGRCRRSGRCRRKASPPPQQPRYPMATVLRLQRPSPFCHSACPGVPWEQATWLRQVKREMNWETSGPFDTRVPYPLATILSFQPPSPICHSERRRGICGAPFGCPTFTGLQPLSVIIPPARRIVGANAWHIKWTKKRPCKIAPDARPGGPPPNVSPARKGWGSNPKNPSAVGAELNLSRPRATRTPLRPSLTRHNFLMQQLFRFLEHLQPLLRQILARTVDIKRQHPHSGGRPFRRYPFRSQFSSNGPGILIEQPLPRMRGICCHPSRPFPCSVRILVRHILFPGHPDLHLFSDAGRPQNGDPQNYRAKSMPAS